MALSTLPEAAPRRLMTSLVVPVILFCLAVAVQGSLIWYLYQRSTVAVERVVSSRIAESAQSVIHDWQQPLQAASHGGSLSETLQRCAANTHLEQVFIVDAGRHLLADIAGGVPGGLVSGLSLPPADLQQALEHDATIVSRPLSSLTPTRLVTIPLHRDGRIWAALCLEMPDPLPGVTQHLQLPLTVAAGAVIGSSALLVAMIMLAQRSLARAESRLAGVQGLAHAGALAAAIAHDIKNPLGLILSSTQLLADSPRLQPGELETLRLIEREVRRADDDLNGYLDLVREMPLKPQTGDLGALMRDTAALVGTKASSLGVAIEVTSAPAIQVLMDRRRIGQVLVNLVLNAIEAQRGGGWVGMRLRVHAGMACVEVSDRGPGIPAQLRRQLFQPFVTTKSDGTGLGLSIARRVCERHGGSLQLLPDGPGAHFLLRLPLSAPEVA
jgi:signal transduction histidine kinase